MPTWLRQRADCHCALEATLRAPPRLGPPRSPAPCACLLAPCACAAASFVQLVGWYPTPGMLPGPQRRGIHRWECSLGSPLAFVHGSAPVEL